MAHWPDRAAAVLENAIEIDRRSSLSPEETMGRYLAGEGQPVVVTDAQASWRAAKMWSLEYFKKHYASDSLIASDRAPLRAEDNPRMHTLRTTLGDFIDYMQQPHHYIAEQERDSPFYGNSWAPFIDHETLRAHISRPYFVPDDIPESETSPDHARLDHSLTKVFLGPAGTVTRLHNDTYHTHAWLSQIRGTKQFILYPPSQAHLIHAGEGIASSQLDSPRCRAKCAQSWLDPLAPEYDAFPRARKATPYVAVCGPGDTILVPSDWFHYAVALTPSITLMRNFMNSANAEPFFDVWNQRQGGLEHRRPPPPMSPRRIPPPALPPLRDAASAAAAAAAAAAMVSSSGSTTNDAKPYQSQPPLPVPRPDGSTTTYNSAAVVPRTAPVLSTAVTHDGGRTVMRHGAGARQPLRALLLDAGMVYGMVHHGACARNHQEGTARVAIEPRGEACGRRAGTAWAWRRPRRAPWRARPREHDPGSVPMWSERLCDD